MQAVLIIALFFLAACALLLLLYRRAALGRLAALPGEVVICEERDIAVDEKRIRYYRYGRCIVRLTDRRLVIAQKVPLFKDAYNVRFVIDYKSSGPGIDIGKMLRAGYVPARVAPAQVTMAPEGASVALTIGLIHSNGNSFSVLRFRSERAAEYARQFNEK
jgi:hypothetical protein